MKFVVIDKKSIDSDDGSVSNRQQDIAGISDNPVQ